MLLSETGWSLGKGHIRQKDNALHLSLAYIFLITGDFSPVTVYS